MSRPRPGPATPQAQTAEASARVRGPQNSRRTGALAPPAAVGSWAPWWRCRPPAEPPRPAPPAGGERRLRPPAPRGSLRSPPRSVRRRRRRRRRRRGRRPRRPPSPHPRPREGLAVSRGSLRGERRGAEDGILQRPEGEPGVRAVHQAGIGRGRSRRVAPLVAVAVAVAVAGFFFFTAVVGFFFVAVAYVVR